MAEPVEEIVQIVQPMEDIVEARVEPLKTEQRRSDKRPQNSARNSRPNPANDDTRERRTRYHRDHDDGPTPIGFGEDIPAFMLIVANAVKA